MKRFRFFFLAAALLMLGMMAGSVLAQTLPDADRDGVPDKMDHCPTDPGPASNYGCPLPQTNTQPQPTAEQPQHPPGDSDGDGTLDEKDQCPLDGGPDWNNGCPTDLTAPPQPKPAITLPTLPTSGECVIATIGQDRVNLRAMPAATAQIIGVLNPADLYPVFAVFADAGGGLWYLVKTGWASGQVIRMGGSCAGLPKFEFGDVLLNFTKGPGAGLTLNFLPVPGGKPFVNLHPFGSDKMSLNFTKLADAFPGAGFSFVLMPFPGTKNQGSQPGTNPRSPGSDVFDDGFLFSQMGDGSVFLVTPHPGQKGENPLNGILIGLSKPDIDPNAILIGLLLPAVQTGDSNVQGILIGLLLPAVQTGDSNNQGILIGLLLPAVQKGEADPPGGLWGFITDGTNNASGGGAGKLPKSLQELSDMGLNFFIPGGGEGGLNFSSPGWGLNLQGALVPAV
jgi:hypothetical protein